MTQTRMFGNPILLQIYLNNFLKIKWSSSCDEESCCQFGNSFFWISLPVQKLNNLCCFIRRNFMPLDPTRKLVAFGHSGLLPQMINPRENPDSYPLQCCRNGDDLLNTTVQSFNVVLPIQDISYIKSTQGCILEPSS